MNGDLGRGIAGILRIGTVLAVLIVGIGFVVASMTGLPSRGSRPLIEYVTDGGPDTQIAVGLFGLTLLPLVTLGFAARIFARDGEGRQLWTALLVLALLIGSLIVSTVVRPAG